MSDLETAARAVLRATDAYRDALNGQGHEGPHDRTIHMEPCCAGAALNPGEVHVYDMTGDCAQCGGQQYGTEDSLQQAIVDLRLALGEPLLPHESWRAGDKAEAPLDDTGHRSVDGYCIEPGCTVHATNPHAKAEALHQRHGGRMAPGCVLCATR